MGVARLLAKGWVVFCLFAGAHALSLAIGRGAEPFPSLQAIAICVGLFGAMGLLFIAGFGASTGTLQRPRAPRWPGFNEVVFIAFVALSFANQVYFAPLLIDHPAAQGIEFAMSNAVPGQRAFEDVLDQCKLDGGRTFAAAFTWLLALIFVASSVSRVGLTAGILRLDHMLRPSGFGPTMLAAIYGFNAIVLFQLLYVGSLYPWIGCWIFPDVTGALLIGLAPLMLAYLIVAALATLKASGPEAE
jgi:hypothetical protein